MKQFLILFLLITSQAFGATEWGDFTVKGNTTLTGPVTLPNDNSALFYEATGNGTNKVTVKAPAALAGDVTFNLPTTNGSNTYVLQTDGSGNTSWVAQAGGGVYTASRVIVSDGSGVLTASSDITVTELGLLDGVTGTLVTAAGAQTLTNKTLTAPTVDTVTFANQGTALFYEGTGGGTDKVTLRAPATLAADYTLTLPGDDGTSNDCLKTDGSGVLSWGSCGGTFTASSTDTLTNKTFDANGTGNSISNIENADINASAAIALSKLATTTANAVMVTNGSGVMSGSASITTTELGLLDGITGTLQTTQTAKYKTATSSGSATLTQTSSEIIFCSASGGDVTYTLPAASASCPSGCRVYTFIKTNATNACIIDPNSSEQINGASTYSLTGNRATITITTDTSSWFILQSFNLP